MKTYFSSLYTIIDLWAKRTHPRAHCRKYRVSFEGNSLYLRPYYYRYCYRHNRNDTVEIARFIDRHTCLVSSGNYAYTYSAKYATQKADETCAVFFVPSLLPDHAENHAFFENELQKAATLFWDSSTWGKYYLRWYFEIAKQYKAYLSYFGFSIPTFLGYELRGKKVQEKLRQQRDEIADRKERYWGTVRIPKWLFYKKTLMPKDIIRIKNAQVRAEFIKKVGIERVIYELGEVVDTAGNYQLVLLDLQDGRKRPFLKMQNPSVPELWHIEGVHPACKTVFDALQYRRYGNTLLERTSWRPQDNKIIDNPNRVNWKPQTLT